MPLANNNYQDYDPYEEYDDDFIYNNPNSNAATTQGPIEYDDDYDPANYDSSNFNSGDYGQGPTVRPPITSNRNQMDYSSYGVDYQGYGDYGAKTSPPQDETGAAAYDYYNYNENYEYDPNNYQGYNSYEGYDGSYEGYEGYDGYNYGDYNYGEGYDYYGNDNGGTGPVVDPKPFSFDPIMNGAESREQLSAPNNQPGCDMAQFTKIKRELEENKVQYSQLMTELEGYYQMEEQGLIGQNGQPKCPEIDMEAVKAQCNLQMMSRISVLVSSDKTSKQVTTALYGVFQKFTAVSKKVSSRIPILHAVVELNNPDFLRVALSLGAKIDETLADGTTVLHKLASMNANEYDPNDKLNKARILLSAGLKTNLVDAYGSTALHVAVKNDDLKFIKFLLASGAKLDDKDNRGKTPYDVAVMNGRRMVQGLLDQFKDEGMAALVNSKKKRKRKK